ncbi:hypothetical protein SLS60_008326 [Paraconiothyrium brasiliense]|uniref:Uncharacterized protein n=1 Tax=Paraconiothyrium brasiliense TaxID=300254 RepID=A0ABR3R125_9PLEO
MESPRQTKEFVICLSCQTQRFNVKPLEHMPKFPTKGATTMTDPLSSDDDIQPPRTPILPSSPRGKTSTVRKIAEKFEQPQLQPPDAEPARPKRDLKEEYKDPWQRKNESQRQSERVRKGSGGLNPHLKEPWERARDEVFSAMRKGIAGGSSDADGSASDDDGLDQLRTLDMLRAQLPEPASLRLPGGAEHVLDSWLGKEEGYGDREPATPSSSMVVSSPACGSSVYSEETSSRLGEGFPEFPFEGVAAYWRERNALEVKAKIVLVKTLLLRCSVLARTAMSMEQAPWKSLLHTKQDDEVEEGDMREEWYKAYHEAGRVADKAEAMATELSNKEFGMEGLHARTWYWKGRADAGMRRWDEAAAAFGKVDVCDAAMTGLTRLERRDVEGLRKECEAQDEHAQQRRQERAWRGEEVGKADLYELTGGLEEEAVESKTFHVEGDEKSDDVKEQRVLMGKAINAVKAKYKMRYIRPFSLEEQEYIITGDPIPKERRTKDMKSEGFHDDDQDEDLEGGRISSSLSKSTIVASDGDISVKG